MIKGARIRVLDNPKMRMQGMAGLSGEIVDAAALRPIVVVRLDDHPREVLLHMIDVEEAPKSGGDDE